MTREEQETIIRFDEADRVAWLYTASPRIMRRWKRRGYELEETRQGKAWRCRVPENLISYRRPPKPDRPKPTHGFKRKAAPEVQEG